MSNSNYSDQDISEALVATQLLSNSNIVGILRSKNRVIEWVNSACEQMLGYESGELIGKPTRVIHVDEQSYKILGEQLNELGSGEISQTRPLLRKDGSAGWYVFNIRKPSINSEVAIGVIVDISPIKELKLALQHSNSQLELALKSSNTGTWTLDFSTSQFTWDSRVSEILGFDAGRSGFSLVEWLSLIHPDDYLNVFTLLENHLQGDSPQFIAEYRIKHSAGHWVWVSSVGKAYRDQAGNLIDGGGVLRDITDQKKLKQEGADLLKNVETLLRNLSSQISSQQSSPSVSMHHSPRLSVRQREILGLIASGLTSVQIAKKLNISSATVATHRRNLLHVLKLHSVADLTRYAIKNKISPLEQD